MQRLSKVSVITLVVCLAVAIGLATAGGLGWFSDSSSSKVRAGQVPMLRHIPADTPLAIVGRNTPEAAQQMSLWVDRIDMDDLTPLLELLNSNDNESAAPLLSWLIEDYFTTVSEGGYEALVERYGSDPEGDYAVYLHGAMPVFRVGLKDQDALLAVLDQAAAESGVNHRIETLGDVEARVWPLVTHTGENAQSLELGAVVADNVLTLSLLSSRDAGATREQRFAQASVNPSLADTGTLGDWARHFERSDLMLGVFDIHRLVEALLLPEQNSAGRELQHLVPEFMASVADKVSVECRRDYVALAAGAPRTVFGTTSYDASDREVKTGFRSVLLLENEEVSTQLQRLPGFLPGYSMTADDKLLAFAQGVNVDELVPALTELWTKFIGTSFDCEQLQDVQRMVNSYNPMMLSIGTAMARGVKGLGFALYDIEADPTSPAGVGGSALVSLSAENPSALATLLTSYAPGMAGTLLPADGTPVAIPSPFLPEGVFAAIKGKHIVVYKGEAAESAANALSSEALSVNGTMGGALNLRRATERLLESPETFNALAAGNCSVSYMMLLAFSDSPFELIYQETINDLGWDGQLDMTMTLPADIRGTLAGTYALSYMDNDDCSWVPTGRETINEDGSGTFASFDEELGCSTFESEYQWQRSGSNLRQITSAQRERDYCEEGWVEQDPDDFTCLIHAPTADGFYCVWQEEGDVEVYRFSRE